MTSEEQIIKQLAQEFRDNQQKLMSLVTNNLTRNKLESVMKLDALMQKMTASAFDNRPGATNPMKNAYQAALKSAFFAKVMLPEKDAAKEAEKHETLLEYALHDMHQKQKKSATIDPEDQLLDEQNTEGEDLRTDMSDEQIQRLLENDPDLPDNLGGLEGKIKQELEETGKELEEQLGLDKIDPRKTPQYKFMTAIQGAMTFKGAEAPPEASPAEAAPDPERKKSSMMKPPRPGGDPKNPFGG